MSERFNTINKLLTLHHKTIAIYSRRVSISDVLAFISLMLSHATMVLIAAISHRSYRQC